MKPPRPIHCLTPLGLERLLAAASPGLDRALFVTAAMTGLRQGELLALRWLDVEWTSGCVLTCRACRRGRLQAAHARRVPLADPVAGELERLFVARYGRDGRTHGDELVFGDPHTGRPLGPGAIRRHFKAACRAAGLEDGLSFDYLRGTFAATMAAQGVGLLTLAQWMGHADIRTTTRYSGFVPWPDDAHAYEIITAAFERPGAPAE